MIEKLLAPAVQKFIRDHAHDDPFQLVLQAKRYPDIPIQEIAAQLAARQKARHKLPEWYATPNLIFPPVLSVEQSSSEAAARFKSTLVSGYHLADLTGGMGADTWYLSQRFQTTDYVEQNAALVEIFRHNVKVLGSNAIRVHQARAEDFLKQLSTPADCIYLDPDRRKESSRKAFMLEETSPDVTQILELLLAKARVVLIKTSPLLDIQQALQALRFVQSVYVVAINNECKEVLYLLENKAKADPEIVAVNLLKQEAQPVLFSTSLQKEQETVVQFSNPVAFIYEPNAAVLKVGAFKSVAARFQLYKLHPNTHLYTSARLVEDFPGRVFRYRQTAAYNKKALRKALPALQANITARNFPDSVKAIRKKTGIKEGGDQYLFATTLTDNKPAVLITEKIR